MTKQIERFKFNQGNNCEIDLETLIIKVEEIEEYIYIKIMHKWNNQTIEFCFK